MVRAVSPGMAPGAGSPDAPEPGRDAMEVVLYGYTTEDAAVINEVLARSP